MPNEPKPIEPTTNTYNERTDSPGENTLDFSPPKTVGARSVPVWPDAAVLRSITPTKTGSRAVPSFASGVTSTSGSGNSTPSRPTTPASTLLELLPHSAPRSTPPCVIHHWNPAAPGDGCG